MILRRPHWHRPPLGHRHGVTTRLRRHVRATAHPSPLRMVLLRAPAAALQSAQRFVRSSDERVPRTRIQLSVAPRLEVHLHANRAADLTPMLGAATQTTVLTRVIEQTVRSTLRHATRIERSQMTVNTTHTRWLRDDITMRAQQQPALVQPPPPLVTTRPPAPPQQPAPAPAPAEAPAPARSVAWKVPDTKTLTDDVMREIDRRIVAERERLGRFG